MQKSAAPSCSLGAYGKLETVNRDCKTGLGPWNRETGDRGTGTGTVKLGPWNSETGDWETGDR